MLSALHIENIAVIKELDIDFSPGLSVLTGETGAGKSIIIDSVRMLLGARADREMIRTGEDRAYVEGLFCALDKETVRDLNALGVSPDENGELLLSRSVTAEGRSVCKIGGRTVPLSLMKEAGGRLIAIHGQHDTQTLLGEDAHMLLLDRYSSAGEELEGYKEAYARSLRLKGRLTALMKEEEYKDEQREKYARAFKEISEAKPKEGEDEALEQRKKLVKDAQKLVKQSRIVYRALYKNEKGGSAADLIEIAQTALEQLSDALPASEEYISRLTACRLELEEIAREASVVSEICTDNPTEELNRIEDRLDLLKGLKKRYGETLSAVIAYKEEAAKKLEELDGREGEIRKLREELEQSVVDAREKAALLSGKRKQGAALLEDSVNRQIGYLDLEKVRFFAEVAPLETASGYPKLTPSGSDRVRFLIASNPGEPPKPVSEIASGGELSRIMLALKVALSDKELTPSLIFDEIDTGISGKTAQKIGIKLREISENTQVFAVTHSAQVAACGHHHFKISKSEVEGRNRTSVRALDEEERVEELARIMGGIHVTDTVRAGAKELLEDGRKRSSGD